MAKDQYTRDNVKASCLRRVIILIDYTRVSNEDSWIDYVKENFCKGKFNKYAPILPENDKSHRENAKGIANRLGIPISEFNRNIIHNFIHNTDYFKDDVSLEISRYYMGLTIDVGNEYRGLDKYMKYVSSIIEAMIQNDSFVEIRRIGIRKYDVFQFDDRDSLKRDLEESTVFSNKIENKMGELERNYIDRYYSVEDEVNVTFTRQLKVVNIDEDRSAFQIVIDSDLSINQWIINQRKLQFPNDMEKCLFDLNAKSFNIFKNFVTEDYLNRSKAKQ